MSAALGLFTDVLSILSFIPSMAAPPAGGDVPTTVLQFHLGINGEGLEDAQGGIGWNGIRLWNSVGEKIGMGGGTTLISDGVATDIKVEQSLGNQAVTVDIVANTDSMCIGYLANTWSDGQLWSWTGDWGKICGLDFYFSNLEFQVDNDQVITPYCTWVDADHTDGIQAGVIAINFPAFYMTEVPEGSDGTEFCGATEGLRAWRDDLDGMQILTPDGPVKRRGESHRHNGRDGRPGKHSGDDRLVVSSIGTQSAAKLCTEPHSFGPDFVSLAEGLYCDMDTRQLMGLCDEDQESTEEEPCFDLESARNGTTSGVVGSRSISSMPRRRGILEW